MSSDDNDKSTQQVLEYYKKYSQNRNLPKYFSGTSVSYLPPIITENEGEITSKPTTSSRQEIQSLKVMKISPKVDELKTAIRNTSPIDSSSSESQSDHKKLEWDNGADIGYNSARKHSKKKLQKSLSLPILDDLKDLNVPTLVASTVITHSSSNENLSILVFSSMSTSNQTSSKNSAKQSTASSSSVADIPKEQNPSTNSSSSLATIDKVKYKVSTSKPDETRFENFQKTIDYLKNKIGLPEAHSTPNATDNQADKVRALEKVKNVKPNILLQNLGYKSTIEEKLDSASSKSNTDNMSVLTEVNKVTRQEELAAERSLPSSSSSKSQTKKIMKKVETKIIELSISTPINVNCRGLDRADKALHTCNEAYPKAVQTDIIQRHHMETQYSFEANENKIRSKAASVSEGTADLASSFEYISVNKTGAVKENEQVESKDQTKIKGVSGVLKEISLSKSGTESSLKSFQEEDIDKHLNLLQKLLKTKKINSSSKRNYIKKLLKQLSELETSNDSSSSSDLFIPKRDMEKERLKFETKPKVVFRDMKGISSFERQHLPCGDRNLNINKQSKSSSESECQCSSRDQATKRKEAVEQEIFTSDSSKQHTTSVNVEDVNITSFRSSKVSSSDKTNKTKPTVSSNTCSYENKLFQTSSLGIESFKTFDREDDKHLQSETRNISNKNSGASESSGKFGTGKTVSFGRSRTTTDLSHKQSDDYLLKFAENERTYQLNWINNEISHLSKLKNILELKSKNTSKVSHPKTSIYNVVQKDSSDKKSERNYIIKTDLNISQDQLVNYVLDGKEYVVSDSQKSSTDSDKAIIADIEVKSSENQTHIKLTTLCASCKKVECICSAGNTIQSKVPSLHSEVKSLCLSCQKMICECKVGQKGDFNDMEQPVLDKLLLNEFSDIGPVSENNYDSLQRAFKKCCCTIENANCSCDFVRKLLTKFRAKRERINSSNEAIQTEVTKVADENVDLQPLREVFCKSTQTHHSVANESTQVSRKSSRSSNSGHIVDTSRFRSLSKDAIEATETAITNDIHTEKVLGSLESFDGNLVETSTETRQVRSTTSGGRKNVGIQVFPNFDDDNKSLASKLESGIQMDLKGINTDSKILEKGSKQTFVDEGTQYSRSIDQNEETAAAISQLRSGNTSTSRQTSMSDQKSSASSRITCCCCKQKAFLAEVSYLKDGNDSLAVCSRCYYNRPRYCSHNQRYTCPCRTHYHSKSSGDVQQYCKCCRLKKSQCLKRPHWLAYTVTLKDDSSERQSRRSFKGSLDNIKVQKGWSWKSLKNKENYYKKDDYKSKSTKKTRKKKATIEDKDEMEKDKYKKNEDAEKDTNTNGDEEKGIHYTLMEYLIKNRPEFISSAEYRRQMLLNSRILREQRKEALKLNFLENNLRNPVEANYKLFTENEMRDINKRHYKKLPEIQEKLISQRENRLRHADRLISNIFAKKIQKSVLQGRDNFPIDKPLTSL